MNTQAFYRVLADWQARGFDWPTANCCTFVSEVLCDVYGIEIEFPVFEDEKQAAKWLHEQGERSLYHYLVKTFGEGIPPLSAQRGFIAYRKGEGLGGASIGVIDRRGLFVGDRGLIQVPLGEIDLAFNPGEFRG